MAFTFLYNNTARVGRLFSNYWQYGIGKVFTSLMFARLEVRKQVTNCRSAGPAVFY